MEIKKQVCYFADLNNILNELMDFQFILVILFFVCLMFLLNSYRNVNFSIY